MIVLESDAYYLLIAKYATGENIAIVADSEPIDGISIKICIND